ncbi:Imm50 family immunity protein [Streptomyces sp. NPDC059991]|uniref:Imm50 family immunity protein n=1 Tax=unclassified Streptomyces TaxID=2593676 RepID=UPI00368C91F5
MFTPFYQAVPDLVDVRVRSVHLDRRGPTVTLRLDLPGPDRLPDGWERGSGRAVQCHVQFLAVEDLVLSHWEPPAVARVELRPLERHRLGVAVVGDGVDLTFDSSASLVAGHVSVFTPDGDGSDGGAHRYARRIDAIRYESVPATYEKVFFERV